MLIRLLQIQIWRQVEKGSKREL